MPLRMRAIPRVWVDLKTTEVMSAVCGLLNVPKARGNSSRKRFENEFAQFIGVKHAVSFTNCRSALYFILKGLNFSQGDEVILPAFTFWVDAAVVELAGLKPVFVDVDPASMNIDPAQIEQAVTKRTKAILLAHLNGLPVDMGAVMSLARRYNLRVIEDSARSCGARCVGKRVGSFDIGAFSFGYGKSFYGFGGGMVTSDDTEFIERLRQLKVDFHQVTVAGMYKIILKGCLLKFLNTPSLHGFTLFPCAYRYEINHDTRFNSWFKIKKPHLTSVPEQFKTDMFHLQTKFCFRQIRTIDQSNAVRQKYLKILNNEFAHLPEVRIPVSPANRENINVHYAVSVERKRELQVFLMENGIDAQDESAEDVTQMERFKKYATALYPNAAKLHQRIVYLPCHPCLSEDDVRRMAARVKEFYGRG
ncbi:MAG: aminotransferase class I/II-fold pyridoxal phosphate-dependent enzyme [Proteobacteria bacterium]|nr:aminotransferase class I/II-fold pyridoxal phosphate-dependent enzyme [Pseudomonadota bacterium]MBU4296676.1 aminotransferase class I/II-fold pyridoxal phosphate-dependent enzyme [Pseudomonadota bacterium]MCG2748469.1 aminotransferase class I/II-fold pyridoxal phosphate-dependent enzyme [Desulfobulbaceae bacterium]